jgi:hypothetical protein
VKTLAVFFSLVVLVLNGIPCCADDCRDDISHQQEERDSHSNELCSPFLSCGACNAVVVLQEEPSEIPFLEPMLGREYIEAEEGLISEITFRIWQPPKNS